ncbi:MAG: AbrB/MazE/SpoVT family DNA-binding domain-containing protein [Chloroflexota bacterium]|nr:AbrB/MazE/SpoVT family DNA-binding domain-containing protein [Chloroflexota bacterium]
MQDFARVSSKGQITIPKAVREALCLKKGDAVLFTFDGDEATITRVPSLMEIAGSLEVPEDKKNVPWKEIRAETWRRRAAERVKR